MKMKWLVPYLLLVASTVRGAPSDRTAEVREAIDDGCARNVILLIGDGLGDSEITAARNYHVGAAGRLALDTLPLTGAYTTYAVSEASPNLPSYVVDSAASATAWATGQKTSNRRLSTSAGSDEPLRTIVELAREHGLRTGSVTTAELTDATPAALVAHVNNRSCHGPANMDMCPQYRKANGGAGSIAEQAVEQRVDIMLGGGRSRFEQVIDGGADAGQTVLEAAQARGYTIVSTADELASVTSGARVLGLFAPANLTAEWAGEGATVYPGSGPQRCREGQRPAHEPSLATMARKALEMLASTDTGFFLQVEGAMIDKKDHAADTCGQIGETVAFDAAVKVALDFARERGDTLVVVTGDHAHTSQIVVAGGMTEEDHPPGMLSTLITNEGVPMTISYATNLPGRWQAHTGTQIRIAAYGPQAANVVGVSDQTDLFYTVARALQLIDGAHCGFWSEVGRFFGLR